MKYIVKGFTASMTAMVVAVFLMCSCGNKKNKSEAIEWNIEIGAQRLSYISEAGKAMTVEWHRNDVMDIWDTKNACNIGRARPTNTNTMKSVVKGVVPSGLAVGDTVELFLPPGDLDYSGQNGSTLNIYSRYNYADGVFVVREVDETTHTVRTNDSIMALKQAVMGFRLVDDKGLAIPVDTLVISSASGKLLVKSHVGPASARYSDLVIANGNADKSSPIYVAIRNKQQDAPDTYTLLAKTRMGRYTATFQANLLYGRTYSKTITMQKK